MSLKSKTMGKVNWIMKNTQNSLSSHLLFYLSQHVTKAKGSIIFEALVYLLQQLFLCQATSTISIPLRLSLIKSKCLYSKLLLTSISRMVCLVLKRFILKRIASSSWKCIVWFSGKYFLLRIRHKIQTSKKNFSPPQKVTRQYQHHSKSYWAVNILSIISTV